MEFVAFQVTNYRNILDSGPIKANRVTAFVGQNEAGKSNLFDALYRVNPFDNQAVYNLDEDWPVDRWGEKDAKAHVTVCRAEFQLMGPEIADLYKHAAKPVPQPTSAAAATPTAGVAAPAKPSAPIMTQVPAKLTLIGIGAYGKPSRFAVEEDAAKIALDEAKADEWAKKNAPKFVYIHDVELTGNTGLTTR